MNFYNEHDPKAAAWLRELIACGEIPAGDVDERSIIDIDPDELSKYVQCHFFAGVAGWSLALRLACWPDNRPIWSGSCPCQPFSEAGKGAGTSDDRHLWPAFFRLIAARRPGIVIGEQVASAAVVGSSAKPTRRKLKGPPESVWLDGVFADLESAHYACGATDIPAAGIGAPHRRQRLWWLAVADGYRCDQGRGSISAAGHYGIVGNGRTCGLADSERAGLEGHAGDGDDRNEPGRDGAGAIGSAPASGGAGDSGMDDTAGARCDGAISQPEGEARDEARLRMSGSGCVAGGLADTGHEPEGRGAGRSEEEGGRPFSDTAGRGPWSDFDIIPCRDGKARRIESGTFPLVAGLPRDVVPSGDPSHAEAQATAEARTTRLRGYGNAIVPELAAQFIVAVQESIL